MYFEIIILIYRFSHFSHLSFVSGPLEVELEVHLDVGRQQVVHHGESDVLLIVHVHVHSEKLGQQGVRILIEVHVVPWQQLLQELRLLVHDLKSKWYGM